jgi:MFS family permease
MVTFSTTTSLTSFFVVLGIVGIGMGFVSIATLLIVQDSLDMADLGIATASQQFFRTLGGTIGVGVTGSFVTLALSNLVDELMQSGLNDLPPSFREHMQQGFDSIFRPEIQALFAPDVQKALQEAVARGVSQVFWISLVASLLCLLLAAVLPSPSASRPH